MSLLVDGYNTLIYYLLPCKANLLIFIQISACLIFGFWTSSVLSPWSLKFFNWCFLSLYRNHYYSLSLVSFSFMKTFTSILMTTPNLREYFWTSSKKMGEVIRKKEENIPFENFQFFRSNKLLDLDWTISLFLINSGLGNFDKENHNNRERELASPQSACRRKITDKWIWSQ